MYKTIRTASGQRQRPGNINTAPHCCILVSPFQNLSFLTIFRSSWEFFVLGEKKFCCEIFDLRKIFTVLLGFLPYMSFVVVLVFFLMIFRVLMILWSICLSLCLFWWYIFFYLISFILFFWRFDDLLSFCPYVFFFTLGVSSFFLGFWC